MTSGLTTIAERYVLEEQIAGGGMAEVWRARDEVLARPVAVKILHPHLAADAAFLERFRREALAAAQLAHPNIVAIYDTGSEGGLGDDEPRHYIVMEHCGGGTLAEHSGDPLAPSRVVAVGHTICEALAYAHRRGIVHRDIKPANVLVTDDGILKVADFGIAKAAFAPGDITTTGSILGTVTYLAPEQAQGREPDARSDLYSLGVVLYELVTGRVPFGGETPLATAMSHVQTPPPPPRSIRAGIPRSLEAVILKALAKDPDERFSSAEDMGAALSELEGRDGGETSVLPPHPGRRVPDAPVVPSGRPDLRWIWPVLGVLVLVAALAVMIPLLVGTDPGGSGRGGENGGRGNGSGTSVRIAAAEDFDPEGDDGEEHPEDAGLAHDGDPGTAWTTSSYQGPIQEIKSGVGLLFDLGEPIEVDRVEITGSIGSLEVRAADAPSASVDGFDEVGDAGSISGDQEVSFEPTEGRYWVVWITSLPGEGGGRASIAEVEFFGP